VAGLTEAHGKAEARSGGGRKAPYRTPISLHPAFPLIVALWFAALLGLGSLMVPAPLIERLVAASGLSAIISQAAPPLGFKARLVLSIAATLGGGLVGLIIARKVAGLHRREVPLPRFAQTVAHSGVNARRPISAHDELGHTGLDGSSARARRSLAIEVDEGPSELFATAALPDGPMKVKEMALPRPEPEDMAQMAQPEADLQPLELSDLEFASHGSGEDHVPGFSMLADEDEHGDSPATPSQLLLRKTSAKPVRKQIFTLDPTPMTVDGEDVDQPAPADLHFSPPSLARTVSMDGAAPGHADTPTSDEHDPVATAQPTDFAALARRAQDMADGLGPDEHNSELEEQVAIMHESAAHDSDWQGAALEDLGLVQLAQRLGSSIEKRREARAAKAAAAVAPVALSPVTAAPLTNDFDMAEAEDAAEAMAAYFGKDAAPAATPHAAPEAAPEAASTPVAQPMAAARPAPARQVFQPLTEEPVPAPLSLSPGTRARIDSEGDDSGDSDDAILNLAASFSLLPQRTGATDATPPAVTAPFNPFERKAQVFVRIEDEPQPEDGHVEPTVVFPGERARMQPQAVSAGFTPGDLPPSDGQANPDQTAVRINAEENEKALREALLNLQRMSGTA
jgi:hypothetical protein